MYGSSRLGTRNIDKSIDDLENQSQNSLYLGEKNYELTNHLGNVLSTVTDRKIPIEGGGNIIGYNADITTATQFYPFGSMTEGALSPLDYRFGFNGQEKDDEITGVTGSHLNFNFRMYDSRIGRFIKVDPIAGKFPWNSPYAFAENRVIDGIDLEGLEHFNVIKNKETGGVDIYLVDAEQVLEFSDPNNQFNANPNNISFLNEWGENIVVDKEKRTITYPNNDPRKGPNMITRSYETGFGEKQTEEIFITRMDLPEELVVGGSRIGVNDPDVWDKVDQSQGTYLGPPKSFDIYCPQNMQQDMEQRMKDLYGASNVDGKINFLTQPSDPNNEVEIDFVYETPELEDL